jgi:class 3 adenylate cyclase
VEIVMSRKVELRWIAEAEARCVRQSALSESAVSEADIGAARAWTRSAWRKVLQRLPRGVAGPMKRLLSTKVVPANPRFAARLQRPHGELEADRLLVTILISDIVDSTKWVATLGDRPWRALLDQHDDSSRYYIKRFGGMEIRNCGDGFLAIFNSPARAVRCVQAIAAAVAPLGISLRSGIHTGEIYLKGNEISGIAAHIAARIAAMAQPCETVVSGTVRDLAVGSGLGFEDRGAHLLRGVPEEIRLYAMRLAPVAGGAAAAGPRRSTTHCGLEDDNVAPAPGSGCFPPWLDLF